MTRLHVHVLGLVLGLFATTGRASADDPWERGVPEARQGQANALFAEGNKLFAQQAHGPALEKYLAAVALWDHPLIRFNIAITKIRLDRILEAADDLEAALRFGQAPFTNELYQQAMDYQKLVAGRVGMLEASCQQRDSAVLLDGRPWFACPGQQTRRVLAGEHVIVAESKGFMTLSKRVLVPGGETVSEKVVLVPLEAVVMLEYPSPRWLPWTVTGAGAAIGLGGLAVWVAGRQQMDRFEDQFAIECPLGCDADLADHQALADQRDGARLKGTIAATMLVAGGAITAGGVVWAIVNRPKRVMPKLEVAPASGGVIAGVGWEF